MKQLITRLDNALHERLRRRAATEGISMNRLVVRALEHLVNESEEPTPDERERMRERARLLGLLSTHPAQSPDPEAREQVIAATRGAGPVGSEALEWDRGPR